MKDEIDIEKAINNLISKIKANPLIIHSEMDLQAILYNELISQDTNLYATNINFNDQILNTYRVHCNYNEHDLVVFSKEYIRDIEKHDFHLYIGEENLVYCDYIIELKFDLSKTKSIEETARKDFKKLEESSNHYYKRYSKRPSLYFFYYILWDIKEKSLPKYLKLFKEFIKETEEHNINYYLLIGPKDNWNDLITEYKGVKLTHLDFMLIK